jgi:phosphoglycolate phosphatase
MKIPQSFKKLPTIKAVLFDLDGTLLNTLADLADSMNAVLAAENLPQHPQEAYKYFVGDGVANLVRRALPEALRQDEQVVVDYVSQMRHKYAERWKHKTTPYPGVPELLKELALRKLPFAVYSNKPDDFTRQMVAHFFPQDFFAAVVGAKPGVAVKPNPEPALEIAAKLAITPEHFLYLGDTGTDMQTARAAGMFPVGALWGFRPQVELLENGAVFTVQAPLELLTLI